jgi:hypothetical protein
MWEDDYPEVWSLDDLDEDQRAEGEECGCEEGKLYEGPPYDPSEITFCPICGEQIVQCYSSCNHMVFSYTVNGYSFIDDDFKSFINSKIELINREKPDDIYIDFIKNESWVHPYDEEIEVLTENNIKVVTQHVLCDDPLGSVAPIFGFLPDEYMKKIKNS